MAPSFLHWFFHPLSIFHISLIICCLGHLVLLWGLTGGAVVWWTWRGGADKGGGQCTGGGCSLGLLPGQGRLLNREGRKVTVDDKVWLTDTDIKPRKMCTDIQWEWNGLWRAKCSSHTHTCMRVHTHNIYTLSNSTSALGHCLSPENRAGGSGGGWGVWGGGYWGLGGREGGPHTLSLPHTNSNACTEKQEKLPDLLRQLLHRQGGFDLWPRCLRSPLGVETSSVSQAGGCAPSGSQPLVQFLPVAKSTLKTSSVWCPARTPSLSLVLNAYCPRNRQSVFHDHVLIFQGFGVNLKHVI